MKLVNNGNPLISIVIISYNEEKYIVKLLESIKNQDYKNFEVILVDDHSTDQTIEVAKKFQNKILMKIVQKNKKGPSRSRNYGASFAKGSIILFLDSDVILPRGCLTEILKEFSEKKLSIATLNFEPISHNKLDKIFTKFYKFWLKVAQYYNPHAMGACMMVRKELHDKIKFDETIIIAEDFDYSKRASMLGKFKFLNNTPIKISWRRFRNESRLKLYSKYIYHELYRIFIGEIRKEITNYEFGRHSIEEAT